MGLGRVINQFPQCREGWRTEFVLIGMTDRYAIRDDQWSRIEHLLPGRAGQPGAKARYNRLFVNAVLHRYRAGTPWRDLPEHFGDFRVVHLCH